MLKKYLIQYWKKFQKHSKHSKHPSVIVINNATSGRMFQFSCVSVDDDAFKEIKSSARVKLPGVMTFLETFKKSDIFLTTFLTFFQFLCKWRKVLKSP